MKNNQNSSWPDDPVIEEIRAIRRKLWKEAGETVEGYIRLIQRMTKQKPQATKKKGGKTRPKRKPRSSRSAGTSRTTKRLRKGAESEPS